MTRSRSLAIPLIAGAFAIMACAPASAAGPLPGGPDDSAPHLAIKRRHGWPNTMVVEATGLDPSALAALKPSERTPDRWRSFLVVRVVRPGVDAKDSPPLLGTYELVGNTLRFRPRFPMEWGIRYRAEFDPRGGKSPPESRLTDQIQIDINRPPASPTSTVTAVYPKREALPENLLRFYIHFSAPMSRGEAYRHIRLLDASGHPIADPFLEIDEELWSGDGKRFTLLFDPGRIKRGLKPHEEVGPVLVAGRSYELVIDPGWKDAEGNPLRSGYRKAFRAVAADETSPDPKTWALEVPPPGTKDALGLHFPEPLDRALLDRLIEVRDEQGHPVAGTIAVADEETRWYFNPSLPWRAGSYRLVIGTELEDVAGNSIARPFEVDEVKPITRRIVGETVELPFRIGSASR